MKASLTQKEHYSIATIPVKDSQIVVAHITADMHHTGADTEFSPWMLLPDMLKSGSGNLTRDAFLHAVSMLGATVDISINNKFVTLYMSSTAQNFSKLLTLVEQMLLAPTFATAELTRVKLTTKNELETARENSKWLAEIGLRNSLWDKTDRRSIPTIDERLSVIETIQKKELTTTLQTFRRSYWNCTIGGAPTAIQLFEHRLQSWQSQQTLKKDGPQKAKAQNKKLVLHDIPSRQNIDFSIGARVPLTISDTDFPALGIAMAVLGWSGFSGRLMSTVREKEGLTYGIYAKAEAFFGTETGHWRVFTFFAPDKSLQGLTSTFREIKKLYQKGVTESELVAFKKIIATNDTLSHDSLLTYTQKIHGYHVQGRTLADIESLREKQAHVTVHEVNQVIKKYLKPNDLVISAAGPVNIVRKQLQDFADKR